MLENFGIKGMDVEQWLQLYKENHTFFTNRVDKDGVMDIDEVFEPEKMVDFALIQPLVKKLSENLPNYFSHYGLCPEDMVSKTIGRGKFAKMTWSRHITEHMARMPISWYKKTVVAGLVSQICGIIDSYPVSSSRVCAKLSINPDIFRMLGHFDCDTSSCFRDNSLNGSHKYMIGQNHNSFVVFEDTIRNGVTFRILGFVKPQESIVTLTNCYSYYSTLDRTAVQFAVARKLLGTKPHVVTGETTLNGIWQNSDTISFCAEPRSEPVVYDFYTKNLDQFRKCYHCCRPSDKLIRGNRNYMYCHICAEKGFLDEFTGLLCMGDSNPAYLDKDKLIRVSNDTLSRFFTLCQDTNRYFRKEDIRMVDERQLSVFSLQKYGYQDCVGCQNPFKIGTECPICKKFNSK